MNCRTQASPPAITGPDDFFAPVQPEFALGDKVVYRNQEGVIQGRCFGHRHGSCEDTRYDVRIAGKVIANVDQCELSAA